MRVRTAKLRNRRIILEFSKKVDQESAWLLNQKNQLHLVRKSKRSQFSNILQISAPGVYEDLSTDDDLEFLNSVIVNSDRPTSQCGK